MEETPIKLLLTPGPVSVHPTVLQALYAYPNLHHRTSEFSKLLQEVLDTMRSLFKVPEYYEIALLGTSGTGITETMVRFAAALRKKKAIVFTNGQFGDRILHMVQRVGIPHIVVRSGAHEPYNLELLESYLKSDPEIGSVFAVHHETSLGQVNNLQAFAKLCDTYGAILCVDMVSSLAGESFDFSTFSPHIGVSVSGKALAAFPGVAFAFVRSDVFDKIDTNHYSQHYFDLKKYISFWKEHASMPFTPPVPLFPPLLQALRLIAQEGLEQKWKRHQNVLATMDSYFSSLGFKALDVVNPSNTTRTYTYQPEQEVFFDKLIARMRSLGYLLYQNPYYHRPLRQFQVSSMGWIECGEIEAMVDSLRKEGFC